MSKTREQPEGQRTTNSKPIRTSPAVQGSDSGCAQGEAAGETRKETDQTQE